MIKWLESFLRFSQLRNTSDIIRARAVYFVGIAFILTQIVNIAMMSFTYGEWTLDHWISVVACSLIILLVIGLRFSKKFAAFALGFNFLLLAGISASAIPEYTGINSALIQLLILGCFLNGFISGWRMATAFGAVALGFTWFLYVVSANAPTSALFSDGMYAAANFQRAVQASLALFLATMISSIFSDEKLKNP